MKNDLKRALDAELRSVRVTNGMKRGIMAAAVSGQAAKKRMSFVPVMAIAAALMILVGGASFLAQRPILPDLSTTPLSAAGNQGGWVFVSDGDELYHWASACGSMTGSRRVRPEAARAEGRQACSKCAFEGGAEAEKLVWMSGKANFYHAKWDCGGLTGAVGMLEDEAKQLGGKACGACFDGVAEEATATPEPTQVSFAVQLPESTWTPATPEPTENVQMAKPTPTPMGTASPMPMQATVEPKVNEETVKMVDSTPTPMATEEPAVTDEVWTSESDGFYHIREHASHGTHHTHAYEETPCAMSREAAIRMGKHACYCMDGGEVTNDVWSANADDCYHIRAHARCINGEAPVCLDESQAIAQGKQACYCMQGGEIMVWVAADAEGYHADAHCGGMENAYPCTMSEAVAAGKRRCTVCMNATDETVWMQEVGESCGYYHAVRHCQSMKNAYPATADYARQEGRTACPVCVRDQVWLGEACYHAENKCLGVEYALSAAATDAQAAGLKACHVCMPQDPDMTVWIDETSYHCALACPNGENVQQSFLRHAQEAGLTACKKCEGTDILVPDAANEMVWPGKAFYHKNSQCMGEIFTHQCLKSELNGEKWGCLVCCMDFDVDLDAAVEDGQVWVGDSHYHHSNTCGGKAFALAIDEEKAVNIGLQACSECTDHACADVCLVSEGEAVYHHRNNCSGGNHYRACLTDDAEQEGRTPCSACIPEKYWMNDGGKYYHTSEHCSGMNGAHSCRERDATQAGKTACPNCLSQKAHHQEQAHHVEEAHHTETNTTHHAEKTSSSSSSKSSHHEEKKHSSGSKHSSKH